MRHAIAVVSVLALAAAAARNDDVFRTDDVPRVIETEAVESAPPLDPLRLLHVRPPEPAQGALRGSSIRTAATGSGGGVSVAVAAGIDGDHLISTTDGWKSRDAKWTTIRGPADHIGGVELVALLNGRVLAVWDEIRVDGAGTFDVLGAYRTDDGWGDAIVIASGPRFQARPSVAVSPGGEAWVAWEEGPPNWGTTYRSVDRLWNNVTDTRGPLHSWRTIQIAKIDPDGGVREIDERFPMPSFRVARANEERREEADLIGVFYERPVIAFDRTGGLWVAYRHVHQAQLANTGKTTTHVEYGFDVHVVRHGNAGWSPPDRLDRRQRSGDQRLWLEPRASSMKVVCEVGRSDRRKSDEPSGELVVGEVGFDMAEFTVGPTRFSDPIRRVAAPLEPRATVRERSTATVADRTYTLLFGDLHRHTDLSLCFPFYDGSLDDAYRYVRGPGGLDFVGITDHARDLDQGNVDGDPWLRTIQHVDRFHVPGRFAAFYSFERSQGHTDHNVIAMRPDVLRPHRPPLREFWAQFQPNDVITIPHATAPKPGTRFCGNVWTKRDDERRPLAEVYQSYRDVDSLKELQVKALATGQKLGFIASSDHLSTSGAFACVWAEGEGPAVVDRQPIFDALRARRTYGATARIELRAMCGDAWMGEELEGDGPFEIDIHADGVGPLDRIEMWSNGELAETIPLEGRDAADLEWTWSGPPEDAHGWLVVRVVQADGEQAWASPFFAAWDRAPNASDD